MDAREKVSVLVCTKDRPETACKLLDFLDRQTVTPDEIIVVDGSRVPVLAARLAGRARVRYVHQADHRGLTHGRNLGSSLAIGDILVCLDDDLEPPPEFLERLLAPYDDPRLGGTGGVALEEEVPSFGRRAFLRLFQRGPFQTLPPLYQAAESAVERPLLVRRLSGGVASYRRRIFASLAWDENLRGYCHGEDLDYSFRASRLAPLVLVPAARTPHAYLGWRMLDQRSRFQAKVDAFGYHYLKNLREERRAGAAFALLLVGILGEAILAAVRRHSLDPLTGTVAGWRDLRRGLSGACGFIDRDPRELSPAERAGERAASGHGKAS